jgi:DNA-directed RNA polymerase
MASKWREDGYKVNLCKERADLNWPTGPQDCYQYIAEYGTKTAQEMVDGTRETFDNRDVSDQDRENAAVWLDQGITRKVTKRNTMTWSYSVTLIGMADQLRDEIMDDLTAHCDDHNEPHPFGDDAGFSACLTMAGINKDSIEAVIQSGAHGMAFLRKIARILAADGKHMQWTSLIGFPAAQQYQQEEKNRVRGFLHERDKKKRSYRSSLTEEVGGVDLTASLDGAAPNWVHHLDSTHLMMTVNKAKEHDVTNLMVVHDSFSTDVASAQVMLDCIRATMVEMYEEECHYTSLLNDSKLLHSDPNNVGPQADLDAIDIQIASETDDEALELLMEERENIKKRFVVWPEIPPKGEGDNAMDVFEILESDHAFA